MSPLTDPDTSNRSGARILRVSVPADAYVHEAEGAAEVLRPLIGSRYVSPCMNVVTGTLRCLALLRIHRPAFEPEFEAGRTLWMPSDLHAAPHAFNQIYLDNREYKKTLKAVSEWNDYMPLRVRLVVMNWLRRHVERPYIHRHVGFDDEEEEWLA